jgi:hypothetical protein
VTTFQGFRDSLGIATNVLSARLDRLCDEGLLDRVGSSRQRYELTRKGEALAPVLITLMHWGDRFYARPGGPPRLTLHRDCGGRVDADLRCRDCGIQVPFSDIAVEPGPGLVAAGRS